MSSEQVSEIVSRAFTLGMATQQWIYSPPNDNISMNAAMRYLARLGYKNPKSVLQSLQHDGTLHMHKPHGSSGNAKVSVSAMELQRALLGMKMNEIIY